MKKKKAYWDMNTQELREATKMFDDPAYDPPAVKPTATQGAQQRKWKRARSVAKSRLMLSLEQKLIEQTDHYAADHGISFSEVVADALRRLLQKKSA